MSSPARLRDRLQALNVSLVADLLRQVTTDQLVMSGLKRMGPLGRTMVGRARTLRFLPPRSDAPPADRQLRRKVIDAVATGDILVFDAGSLPNNPIFGDMVALRALQAGCAGLVVDGAIRDRAQMSEIGFPVFAKEVWPAPSLTPLVAWQHDVDIQCGGVFVRPGDWIVGDDDGVIVLPEVHAETVADKGEAMLKREEFSQKLLVRGHSLEACFPIPEGLSGAYEAWRDGSPLPDPESVEPGRIPQ